MSAPERGCGRDVQPGARIDNRPGLGQKVPMSDPAPALPSATVMLVRDAPRFEVLMVQRHHQIEFASGALVFPGGKLEDSDRDRAWLAHVTGAEDLVESERALRICAIREAFEESGILLAEDEGDVADPIEVRAAAGRDDVASGRVAFRDFVAGHRLKLDLAAMAPFAHWITPALMKKRFDTRFYLMAAPSDQVAACDGYETVDALWIAPAEALRLQEAGERTIVFPTRLNLKLLATATSTADALAGAASRDVRPIEPDVKDEGGQYTVSIPDDVGYGAVPPQRL